MIQINLKHSGAAGGTESLADKIADSGINIRVLILCAIVGFGPQYFVEPTWDEEYSQKQAEIKVLQTEEKKLKDKFQSLQALSERLDKLKEEEKSLVSRLDVVGQVFDKKDNPMKIMHYVAENIPSQIWIKTIEIENNIFKLSGYSTSYKVIGNFIEMLNQSIFFGQNVKLENYITKEYKTTGARVEEFFVSGQVERFE